MEIFKAGKIGMGFLGGLIFGPGNFLGFDCCPASWSFPSPEIWSTPTPTPWEMNYVDYNICGIVSYPCYHLNAIADDDDPDTTHLYAEYRLPSTQSFALIGGYWLDPSKHVTIVSLSGSWNKANDRRGTLRLISSSGISTRWTCFVKEKKWIKMHKLLNNLKKKRSRSWEVNFQQVSSDIFKTRSKCFSDFVKNRRPLLAPLIENLFEI